MESIRAACWVGSCLPTEPTEKWWNQGYALTSVLSQGSVPYHGLGSGKLTSLRIHGLEHFPEKICLWLHCCNCWLTTVIHEGFFFSFWMFYSIFTSYIYIYIIQTANSSRQGLLCFWVLPKNWYCIKETDVRKRTSNTCYGMWLQLCTQHLFQCHSFPDEPNNYLHWHFPTKGVWDME